MAQCNPPHPDHGVGAVPFEAPLALQMYIQGVQGRTLGRAGLSMPKGSHCCVMRPCFYHHCQCILILRRSSVGGGGAY